MEEEVKLPEELEEIILRHFERQYDEFGDIDDYKEDREDRLDYRVYI